MLFQELNETEKYDGIWARSSILYASKKGLSDIFSKMVEAIKSDGVIYTSFKYGNFEGERNGKYFSDFTTDSFNIVQYICRAVSTITYCRGVNI